MSTNVQQNMQTWNYLKEGENNFEFQNETASWHDINVYSDQEYSTSLYNLQHTNQLAKIH